MKKSTHAVHTGTLPDPLTGGVNSPIITSSAFGYLDQDTVRYPRYFNAPNQHGVVEKLCALEQAEAGLLFSSGMAAISTALNSQLNPGDHAVFLEGLYGGTMDLITAELVRLGIEYSIVEGQTAAFAEAVQDNTKVIYVESPTNPLLEVLDLGELARLARQRQIVTMIDNTFATPILQNPLKLGFDLVLHSGTKYLGGHSDLCCGAALGSRAVIGAMQPLAIRYGGSINALDCYLLERSLKTLDIRVRQQSHNAQALADALQQQSAVSEVFYPGLATHPAYALTRQQMQHPGAMLSFKLDAAIDPVAMQRRLKIIKPAVSLGGVESTICQPTKTSHLKMADSERQRLGITDQLLRLSVGIENIEDLVQDLTQALA